MINFNGNLVNANQNVISIDNRGFKFGDALFETIKVVNSNILFLEDHYFRLMSSMRILRMEIPMDFTLEYFQDELLKTITTNGLSESSARLRITVFRADGGLYNPITNDISYIIESKILVNDTYSFSEQHYEIDIFKDYYISPSLLSNIKTNNRIINVVGSVFAKENNLNNVVLINTNRQIVEMLQSNIFIVQGSHIKTPPLSSGCINGILRKQIIKILKTSEYDLEETDISPFELQSADSLFITNVISGIIPISKFRKNIYSSDISLDICKLLNNYVKNTIQIESP